MVQVRRAVHRDAEAIARLTAEAAAEIGALTALDVDRIRAHAFGGNALFEAWVAEERHGKPPCGHAIVTRSYDIRRGCPVMVLSELYVRPDQRRAGVARLLMSAIARRAVDLGARELTITTGVDNAVAQRFFAAIGASLREAAVFVMPADGLQWLATEGL
ncbi:MAG TPA: GNAT family N-acetyltransferase [Caulobacterales bacterium]|nr:GNAT family N-acetyltransferase [Caulobacterales bacterium]